MQAPCKDCPDRHELCHAHCPKYIEYRKWLDVVNEEKRKQRILDSYEFEDVAKRYNPRPKRHY